jgi:hypothetical protein
MSAEGSTMTVYTLEKCLEYAEPVLCLTALASLWRARALKQYGFLSVLLATRTVVLGIELLIVAYGVRLFGELRGYEIYFYFYWSAFAIESILMLAVICSMYRLAMAPLKGLQSLGMLVFAWVGGISVLVALGVSFAPHTTSTRYVLTFVSQMQRTQSILILCLLLFVCFAIRPMGLSYRSRIFGVSLGLGIMATISLAQSAWVGHEHSMWGTFDFIHDLVCCFTLLIWTTYFALPEPKRRIITLPTTSPFLRWNQISEVLGDDPGHVAIAGLPPEMLAPAEVEIMRRASLKMQFTWDSEAGALQSK